MDEAMFAFFAAFVTTLCFIMLLRHNKREAKRFDKFCRDSLAELEKVGSLPPVTMDNPGPNVQVMIDEDGNVWHSRIVGRKTPEELANLRGTIPLSSANKSSVTTVPASTPKKPVKRVPEGRRTMWD